MTPQPPSFLFLAHISSVPVRLIPQLSLVNGVQRHETGMVNADSAFCFLGIFLLYIA